MKIMRGFHRYQRVLASIKMLSSQTVKSRGQPWLNLSVKLADSGFLP